MPRYLTKHPDAQPPLERSPAKDGRLIERLVYELGNGYSARKPIESVWIEGTRQYAGVPEMPVRNQPIPNAPNIELPIGALICDSLYAQATDTLYSASPILTVREMSDAWTPHVEPMQKFVNWMAANEIGLRFATDNTFQDDIQLGTGIFYCPWVKEEKNTRIRKIVAEEPRVIPISPEDFLVPGGSRGDHQQDEWCDIRFWYTKGEFESQAREQKWNTAVAKPVAMQDATRAYHEQINRTSSTPAQHERFSVENVWTYFDYENDGIDRDLMVAFDMNSRSILGLGYNRYDTRPIESMRFQIRRHLFWGLGVMEMAQPFQGAGTEILNHFLLNMLLVNGRMYAAKSGTVPDFERVWPMKIVGVESTDDIKELRLSDVYPSALQGLERVIQLAERRVGVTGEFTSGNPASRILGTRTPGITAMSALQSVNRRFTPAFDGMRLNTAAAVRQCVWRYAERVRLGDSKVTLHLTRLLGDRDAQLVLELLRQDDFERCVAVEFTAVSASVNREADRQNAMMVMDKLGAYNTQLLTTLMQLTGSQPGAPPDPIVIEVTKKLMKTTNAAMDMFLRSFDHVRNPQTLLVDLDAELDGVTQQAQDAQDTQSIVGSVISALSGGAGGGEVSPGNTPLPPAVASDTGQ